MPIYTKTQNNPEKYKRNWNERQKNIYKSGLEAEAFILFS